MDALDLLLTRSSVPAKLPAAPGPDDAALERMFRAAVRAPDHGRLRPWRFIVIRGAGRERLGDVFAEALRRRDPAATETALEKERARPMRAPVLVAVVARLTPENPKVPESEQLLSAGAAATQIVLAAQATGFAAIWLTGANAYDAHVLEALGLAGNERLVGYLYIGSQGGREAQNKQRPDWRDHVSEWS